MNMDKLYNSLPVGVKAKILKDARERFGGDVSKAIFFRLSQVCTPCEADER